ncbi:response regulator [Onishia taeanensis]
MDLHLPGMDGYQALAAMRRLPAHADLPVIALSANAMARDQKRGQQAGFDDYLTKPLDLATLCETLSRLLH